jgi:hypothetical protein
LPAAFPQNLARFFCPQRNVKTLEYLPLFANSLAEKIEKNDTAALFY